MRTSLILCFSLACAPAPEFGCGNDARPCKVELGEYLVRLPSAWDRTTPIPAYVYFHGYGGQAAQVVASETHRDAVEELGVIGIYPNGLDERWAFGGSSRGGRDELAFTEQFVDDALQRFPIDRAKLAITGFSIGGSMVWDLACQRPDIAPLFAPVSGTMWNPMPPACDTSSVRIYHEHGTADSTFPLEGRPIGTMRQGDTREAFQIMVTSQSCGEPIEESWQHGSCQVWSGCVSGAELRLCLHAGGHRVTTGWHARTMAQLTE